MSETFHLMIDDCSIYIDELEQLDPHTEIEDCSIDSAIQWTRKQVEDAVHPIANILNSLYNAISDIAPDEMEVSMQFKICLNGATPVLKIISSEASAEIAVKFTWKKPS